MSKSKGGVYRKKQHRGQLQQRQDFRRAEKRVAMKLAGGQRGDRHQYQRPRHRMRREVAKYLAQAPVKPPPGAPPIQGTRYELLEASKSRACGVQCASRENRRRALQKDGEIRPRRQCCMNEFAVELG